MFEYMMCLTYPPLGGVHGTSGSPPKVVAGGDSQDITWWNQDCHFFCFAV